MSLIIKRGDITRVRADAIVNPTNARFSGSGGADAAIHKAAGPFLYLEAVNKYGGILPGEALITVGYQLPAKYVIHTVGPKWEGGNQGERELLAQCYRNCLEVASRYHLATVAFPLISGGTYGFPNDEAVRIAITVIEDYIQNKDSLTVLLVIRERSVYNMVANNYADRKTAEDTEGRSFRIPITPAEMESLKTMIGEKEETFGELLRRLVFESGKRAAEIYNAVYVSKSTFSKILNNEDYHPTKQTVLALGIGLQLPWKQFQRFVQCAGYAMTRNQTLDIVTEYCIKHKIYDVEDINDILYETDKDIPLFGA